MCGSPVGVLMIDRFVLQSAGFLFGWIFSCYCLLRLQDHSITFFILEMLKLVYHRLGIRKDYMSGAIVDDAIWLDNVMFATI